MTTPPSGLVLVNVDVTGLTDGVKDGLPVGLSVIKVEAESLLVSEQPIPHFTRECRGLKEQEREKKTNGSTATYLLAGGRSSQNEKYWQIPWGTCQASKK